MLAVVTGGGGCGTCEVYPANWAPTRLTPFAAAGLSAVRPNPAVYMGESFCAIIGFEYRGELPESDRAGSAGAPS